MFKVGDKVRCLQGNKDFLRSWDPEMNNYVGKTARITRIFEDRPHEEDYIIYYIDIDDGEWMWTNKTLKLKRKLKTLKNQ